MVAVISSAAPSAPWPSDGRRPYDLATRHADYPEWTGSPRRSILICTHPRSGSTLLGEALYFAGGMGCPLEYFHRGFRPSLAERWQSGDIHSFVRAVYRFRTDTTGVLSVKLFWSDIEDIVGELQPSLFEELRDRPADSMGPATYRKVRGMLGELFPNPVFIRLQRHDRVRQAVSTLVATQTKFWRSIPGVGEQSPTRDAAYDRERIFNFLAFSDYCDAHWSSFFHAAGDPFHGVCYEDLVREYAPTLRRLFDFMGCRGELPAARMRRQADAVSEGMVLRFLKEYGERSSETAPVSFPG